MYKNIKIYFKLIKLFFKKDIHYPIPTYTLLIYSLKKLYVIYTFS